MTIESGIKLEAGWLSHLESEFNQPYMKSLRAFLIEQKQVGKTIYPRGNDVFNALNATPLNKVKVVILGQDPYHGPGQAHGLCFSVQNGVKTPPSLVNIFKELKSDLGLKAESLSSGCLSSWADQGVLLLNSVLTVEKANAASHQGKGWEVFTDKIIELVNNEVSGCVFLLWGAYAQKKGAVIDTKKHLVLKAPHPSPLSAYRGFMGCQHFSQCNAYLKNKAVAEIDWRTDTRGME